MQFWEFGLGVFCSSVWCKALVTEVEKQGKLTFLDWLTFVTGGRAEAPVVLLTSNTTIPCEYYLQYVEYSYETVPRYSLSQEWCFRQSTPVVTTAWEYNWEKVVLWKHDQDTH